MRYPIRNPCIHTYIHWSQCDILMQARVYNAILKNPSDNLLWRALPRVSFHPPSLPGLRTGIHRHARFNVRSMANKRRLGVPRCWKTNVASNGIAAGIVHYTTVQLLSHTIHLLLFFKPFLPRTRNFNQKSTKHPAQLNTTCRISRKTWVLFAILVVFEIG